MTAPSSLLLVGKEENKSVDSERRNENVFRFVFRAVEHMGICILSLAAIVQQMVACRCQITSQLGTIVNVLAARYNSISIWKRRG